MVSLSAHNADIVIPLSSFRVEEPIAVPMLIVGKPVQEVIVPRILVTGP